MHLLIAEDDPATAELIEASVRVLWPDARIDLAPDGAAALRRFAEERPDLVLLDVTMPPPDGLAVCHQIRATDAAVPILILTGRDTDVDELRGLDAGADAYLTKPFEVVKLLAHLRALVRRAGMPWHPPDDVPRAEEVSRAEVTVGDLAIDLAAREVRLRGRVVGLTPTEWVLLETLATNAGRVVPHRTLVEQVWGGRGGPKDLKVYINRLRRKLGDDVARPRYIETRRNQGYRLVAP
jgi:DNA-binding response OmpR family regulator